MNLTARDWLPPDRRRFIRRSKEGNPGWGETTSTCSWLFHRCYLQSWRSWLSASQLQAIDSSFFCFESAEPFFLW